MALFKKEEAREDAATREEVKKEKEVTWQIGEVATQTAPVIINSETEEKLDIYFALAKILNDLEYIKSFLKE